MDEREDRSWKQHFPTYHFKNRDIALEEYRVAVSTLEADERVFLNATSIAAVVSAAISSIAIGTLDKLAKSVEPIFPVFAVQALALLLAIGFSALSLRYFADRQKAIVFAARKVIVLRRMLGLNYGSLQLVLPNWRIEGADEPFAIRMFPGWDTYVAYPCFAIAGVCSAFSLVVIATILGQVPDGDPATSFSLLAVTLALVAAIFLRLCWTYRRALVDVHERSRLLKAKLIARFLRVGLVTNIEQVIYRATLATYETQRLRINLECMKRLLIHIEDRTFYAHGGVSLRGLARLMRTVIFRQRRSGGSTITQQLVRTLFISDLNKIARRKLIEILLARWFTDVMPKGRQLELYLASVRFETGVQGIAAAMRHFFGKIKTDPSLAECFFLVERISNIRSRVLSPKINQTLEGAVDKKLLSKEDARHAVLLYLRAVNEGKLIDPDGDSTSRLAAAWKIPFGG